MLVVSRKRGESIQIGRDVTVTLLALGHGRVKIGVAAPCDVRIRRTEPTDGPSGLAQGLDVGCQPDARRLIASR